MAEVRQRQKDVGTSGIQGRWGLSDEIVESSVDAQRRSRFVSQETGLASYAVTRVIHGFEELCRRRSMPVPAELRDTIYKILTGELLANAKFFDLEPSRVVSATVYNGLLEDLVDSREFESLRDTPGIFRTAAVTRPSDPAAFLRRVMGTVDSLERDPEFASLKDSPGIFRTAAVGHPSDPAGFLRGVMRSVEALQQDAEFACFRDVSGILRAAAVGRPGDPAGFLRSIKNRAEALQRNPDFSALGDSPVPFIVAAAYYPKDPEDHLRKRLDARMSVDDDMAAEDLLQRQVNVTFALPDESLMPDLDGLDELSPGRRRGRSR